MRHHRQVGLLIYSTTYERAMDQMDEMFNDPGFDDNFRLLPETALGTALSFPDTPDILCRRIFPYTAVMAVHVGEMTAEQMRRSRTEEIQEQFWIGELDE